MWIRGWMREVDKASSIGSIGNDGWMSQVSNGRRRWYTCSHRRYTDSSSSWTYGNNHTLGQSDDVTTCLMIIRVIISICMVVIVCMMTMIIGGTRGVRQCIGRWRKLEECSCGGTRGSENGIGIRVQWFHLVDGGW